jgi:hypothetical protein
LGKAVSGKGIEGLSFCWTADRQTIQHGAGVPSYSLAEIFLPDFNFGDWDFWPTNHPRGKGRMTKRRGQLADLHRKYWLLNTGSLASQAEAFL